MGNQYTLLWKEIIAGSEFSRRFGVEDKHGYLPFYISKKDNLRIQNNETVELTDLMLMQGLLFAYNDDAPDGKQYQELFYNLLNWLYPRIRDISLLVVILDVSTSIRGFQSKFFTYKVMLNADTIIPNHSNIKTYFILSIWDLINENPESPNLNTYLTQLNQAFNSLIVNDIVDLGAKLLIIYYNFVALYFLKRSDEIEDYLTKFVDVHLSRTRLKDKIKYLLENDSSNISITDAFIKDSIKCPSTLSEAVYELSKLFSKEEVVEITKMTFEDFRSEHFTLGLFIRNKFGLWTGNESLMQECGTSDADAASMKIMEEFHKYLQKQKSQT